MSVSVAGADRSCASYRDKPGEPRARATEYPASARTHTLPRHLKSSTFSSNAETLGGKLSFAAAQHKILADLPEQTSDSDERRRSQLNVNLSSKLTSSPDPFNAGNAQKADVTLPDDFPRF